MSPPFSFSRQSIRLSSKTWERMRRNKSEWYLLERSRAFLKVVVTFGLFLSQFPNMSLGNNRKWYLIVRDFLEMNLSALATRILNLLSYPFNFKGVLWTFACRGDKVPLLQSFMVSGIPILDLGAICQIVMPGIMWYTTEFHHTLCCPWDLEVISSYRYQVVFLLWLFV